MLCLPWLLRAVSYALLTSYSDLEDQTLYLYRPVVWLVSLPFMRAAGTVFALGAIALQLVLDKRFCSSSPVDQLFLVTILLAHDEKYCSISVSQGSLR